MPGLAVSFPHPASPVACLSLFRPLPLQELTAARGRLARRRLQMAAQKVVAANRMGLSTVGSRRNSADELQAEAPTYDAASCPGAPTALYDAGAFDPRMI